MCNEICIKRDTVSFISKINSDKHILTNCYHDLWHNEVVRQSIGHQRIVQVNYDDVTETGEFQVLNIAAGTKESVQKYYRECIVKSKI